MDVDVLPYLLNYIYLKKRKKKGKIHVSALRFEVGGYLVLEVSKDTL